MGPSSTLTLLLLISCHLFTIGYLIKNILKEKFKYRRKMLTESNSSHIILTKTFKIYVIHLPCIVNIPYNNTSIQIYK